MPSLSPGGAGYWRLVPWVILVCGAATPAGAASAEAARLDQRAVTLTGQGQYEEAAALFTQALRRNGMRAIQQLLRQMGEG